VIRNIGGRVAAALGAGDVRGGMVLWAAVAPFSLAAPLGSVGLLGLYGLGNVAATLANLNCLSGLIYLPVLALCFLAFHWGYGLGFLLGTMDFGCEEGRTGRPFTS